MLELFKILTSVYLGRETKQTNKKKQNKMVVSVSEVYLTRN